MHSPEPAPDLPDEAALAHVLRETGLGTTPSELHGSLCGFLAGGGRVGGRDWLQHLQLEDAGAPTHDALLDALRDATVEQFDDAGLGLQLLLPDEDTSLATRTDAMVAWCRGFLGGFGLAAAPTNALGTDAAEALQDLARIAASELDVEESEADEDSLVQILEFVRMVPMMVFLDCVAARRPRRELN